MDLQSVIAEQREELEEMEARGRLIPREPLEAAQGILEHPNILAIIGVRRCGKSTFSYLAARERSFGYINFDDERLMAIGSEDLNDLLQAIYTLHGDVEYIVLDEPQQVDGWELFANRLRRSKKVIVTGSSADLLSGELATRLTGRHVTLEMFPFSFREYMAYHSSDKELDDPVTTREKARVLQHLESYLKEGGFPEVQLLGRRMLNQTYEDILTKDIVVRYDVRKRRELREVSRYLMSHPASEVSYRKLANTFGIQQASTISNWVSYLENAFLLFEVARFSYKLKDQARAPRKVYAIDPGLARAVGFTFSENRGALMENTVFLELRRRGGLDGVEIFYWKDQDQREVDFVVKRGDEIEQLIQVTYATNEGDIRDRELDNLAQGSRDLRCQDLLLITWDVEGVTEHEGRRIRLTPLWSWLFSPDTA